MTSTPEYNRRYQRARQRAHRRLAEEHQAEFKQYVREELRIEGVKPKTEDEDDG